jgi:hypothetical protein
MKTSALAVNPSSAGAEAIAAKAIAATAAVPRPAHSRA